MELAERRTPDGRPQPVEAWRAWRLVRRADGSVGLASLFSRDERWTPRSSPRAVCAVEGSYHAAPAPECRCGYYAYADRARLAGAGRRIAVIGRVAMWGSVVAHDFGYRAEYSYPQRLRLVCGPCLRAGRDRPPRWVVERRAELIALCARHGRPVRRSRRTPAVAVESALLDAYAVELLPPTGLAPPPVHRRLGRAVRRALAARTSVAVLLVAVLVASLGVGRWSSDGIDGTDARSALTGRDATAAFADGSGGYDPPSGVRFRTVCGTGPARHIRVARCDGAASWVSNAAFIAGIRPRCFGAVVQTMPGGRTRCWLPLESRS